MYTPFADLASDPPVRGFLHTPASPGGDILVLTHGAGANCQSRLLIEISDAFAAAGFAVLRFDLPFRNERPHGPPSPGGAARDRDGLRRAVAAMKATKAQASAGNEKQPGAENEVRRGRIVLGGHSYGGRQATMLLAEDPTLVDALLLLSYPLHPPRKPAQLRTSHFPKLQTPAFFVHGTRDPFGTIEEMDSALKLIPAPHQLLQMEAAGHDLSVKKALAAPPARVVAEFQNFVRKIVR